MQRENYRIKRGRKCEIIGINDIGGTSLFADLLCPMGNQLALIARPRDHNHLPGWLPRVFVYMFTGAAPCVTSLNASSTT